MRNKVIRLRRLPSICLVLLFLVSVWTTPAFSMPGNDGVVVSFVEKQLSESTASDESSRGQGTYSPVNPPLSFYLSDPISECPSLFERQVIFFVNHERNLVGLPPLELDVRLQIAARWMSNDMAAHSNVPADHVDSLGRSFDIRVSEEGGYPFIHLGEVIAGGFSSPKAVVNAWMNSPGHKARLLDPDYDHIGVGYAYDTGTDHWHYWTADLGSTTEPRQTPPLNCDPKFYLLLLPLIEKQILVEQNIVLLHLLSGRMGN